MIAHRIGTRIALAATLLTLSGASLGAMPVRPAAAASASTTPTSSMRGVYRVVMESEGRAPIAATIVVEQPFDQLEVSLLVDDHVSLLNSVRVEGDTLSAKFSTSHGAATISLRMSGNSANGTITIKGRTWKVAGERSA
jgi:hypothetical protein